MLDLHLFLGQGLRLHVSAAAAAAATGDLDDERWPSGTQWEESFPEKSGLRRVCVCVL